MGFGKNLRLARMIRAKKKEILYYAGGTAKKIFEDKSNEIEEKRKRLVARLKAGDFSRESLSLAREIHKFYKENSKPVVGRILGLPGLRVPADLRASESFVRHVGEGRCEEADWFFLEEEFPRFLKALGGKIEAGLKRVAGKAEGSL